MKPTKFNVSFSFLSVCLVLAACSSSSNEGEPVAPSGSVSLGESCRSNLDCAAIEGRTVKCSCSDDATDPVCVALQKAGESCAITGNFQLTCEAGTTCALTLTDADPTCKAVGTQGQACDGTSSTPCSDDLSCVNEICSVGIGTLGSDCFEDGDCGANYRCDFMSGCVERIELGQSCKDAGVPTAKTCVDGAGCDLYSNECVALKTDGKECGWDSECKSGECSLGGCGKDYRLGSNDGYSCGF